MNLEYVSGDRPSPANGLGPLLQLVMLQGATLSDPAAECASWWLLGPALKRGGGLLMLPHSEVVFFRLLSSYCVQIEVKSSSHVDGYFATYNMLDFLGDVAVV